MKNNILRIAFVLIILNFGYAEIKCQIINSNLNEENLNLFADRTLYISGEQIQFATYLFTHNKSSNINISNINNIDDLDKLVKNLKKQPQKTYFSNVIYVELITPKGDKIVGGKFKSENSFSSGCITIPKDIITGIYYIRAYTKAMRNNDPYNYSYASVKIVNPYKPDILSYNYINKPLKDSVSVIDTIKTQEFLNVSLDKKEYSTRDSVNIKIKGFDLKNPFIGLTISVIPENSFIEQGKVQARNTNTLANQYYYPETNGISLTGSLKDSKSENLIPNTMVNLSILGDKKDFMAARTDSLGRFFFKMPEFTGVRDVFLSTETMADSKSTIQIDNDFCQNKIKLPSPNLHLSEIERKVAYSLALNAQIASNYEKPVTKDTTKKTDKPFYGDPQLKLVLDNYIQLPTIEDYINELIPILYIKKQQGRKYFKIYSTQNEMSFYQPLVLLDLIAIDNPEKILSLSPQKISHIEIVNSTYVKGDIIYGGIISIFSKKGDFAGIDLPSSGLFLDYDFWSDCSYNAPATKLSLNQPDFRNTLFWEPRVNLNTNSTKTLSFVTSDNPGNYTVLVRGITSKGKEFTYKESFYVRTKK